MDIQTFINNYYEAFSKGGIADRFLVFRFSAWRIKADTRLFIQGPSAIRQGEIIRYLHFARIDRLTSFER